MPRQEPGEPYIRVKSPEAKKILDQGNAVVVDVRRQDEWVAYVKGAPDLLLSRCSDYLTTTGEARPLTDETRDRIAAVNRQFARQALRVVGLAQRRLDRKSVV